MIVLGVDPGLATLGWGVIEAERGRQRLVDYGCILTTPAAVLSRPPVPDRAGYARTAEAVPAGGDRL